MRFTTAALMLTLLLLPQTAPADSFGGWEFEPPDDYENTPSQLGVSYAGPNGGYMFLPQTPITGDITATANAVISDALSPDAVRQEMIRDTLPDGGERAVWFASDGATNYIFVTIAQNGQSATALFITPHTDANRIVPETDALVAATFAPVILHDMRPAALPPMDWPAPPTSRTTTTRPRMSAAQARAVGLDPETVLLPGTFHCYIEDSPRAADPRPDLVFDSKLGQRYAITDGTNSAAGKWQIKSDDTFDSFVSFSGPLEGSGRTFINTNDGLGQSFDIDHPFNDAELTCYQDGPAADTTRQRMAAVAPGKGALDCIRADGPPFKLLFGNGIYIADGGRGAYTIALEGGYGQWEGQMSFAGGPFDLFDGTVGAEDGQLKLTVSQTWHEGSIFYSSSETTTLAVCTMPGTPRPDPVYGPDPAPATIAPHGGLPEGLYRSWESRYSYNGGSAQFLFEDVYTWVAPGGRIIENPDWQAIGDMPDCSRTTPSGEEVCGEYRIVGAMISRRDERDHAPDAWSDNERLTLTDTGFTIDDTDYTRVTPPALPDLVGTWTVDDFTGGGPAFGAGVGNYTDSETWWIFTPEGRFEWQTSGTNTTLITPDPILGGVSGGGSSNFSDGGAGNFTLTDIWLELAFDDGRNKRLLVFAPPPDDDGTRGITIDGMDLRAQ